MSNYNTLKATINAGIKQNGNQEITGSVLNSVLNQMVNILGTGYQFSGVATPATNPGTPDAKVFYIANGKGTYTNFDGIEVTEDDVVILYYDTAWHKVSTGVASQAKLTELESEKTPITSIYGEDVIIGYGLAYDAKNKVIILSKDGGVIVSPFIPIANGDSIEWVHRFKADNNFRAIMYDSNKRVLDSWGAGNLGYRTISVSEDNAAYIRATMNNASVDECFVKVNNVKVWNDGFYKKTLKEHVTNIENIVGNVDNVEERLRKIDNTNVEQSNAINILALEKTSVMSIYGEDVSLGYGITTNNKIIQSDIALITPNIPVSNGDAIEWVHRFKTDNNFILTLCDSNGNVLDAWSAGDLGYRAMTISYENAAYIRATMYNASVDECFVKVNNVKVWNDSFYKKTLKEYIVTPSQGGDADKPQEVELRELANDNELIRRRRFAELNGEIVEEEYNHVSTTGEIGYISPYIAVSGTIDVWLNYSKVVAYDENRRFVSFWRTTDSVSTIEIPTEVKYIRVAVYNESLSQSYIRDHDTGAVIWKPFQITRPSKSILELFPQEEYEPIIANITNDLKIDSPEHRSPRTFGMLFLGDLHTCDGIMREVMEFYNLYNPYLNSIVLGGDMVSFWDDGFDWWASVGAKRCLPIIGNHEVLYDYHKYAQGSGSDAAPKVNGVEVDIYKLTCISAKQCYDRYIQPYLAHTAFTSYVDGKCYWYKDFVDEKLRLIGLDDFHWKESVPLVGGAISSVYPDGTSVDTGEQQLWFRNVLEDARTKGYRVLVSHHAPAEFDAINCPFTIQDFNNEGTRSKATDDELAEVQTFIDNGGTFVAWLTGHLHQDVIGTCKNYPNQLQLAIDTSRIPRNINGSSVYQGGNYKIADTKSNYCLDVVAITEKTITIQRVGTEYDKIGRKIESFVYNFTTHEIIHK